MGVTRTYQAAGNLLAIGTSLAGGASSTAVYLDLSASSFGGAIQVVWTGGGTVAATNGLAINVYAAGDTTPNYDTVPAPYSPSVPTIVSTTQRQTIRLGVGKWKIVLTNLDATNAIAVGITSMTDA